MCECLCGNIKEHVALQLGDTTIVVDAYPGCKECAPLIGFDVRLFNKKGRAEWLDGEPKCVEPDEYGVIPSAASFDLFSIEDVCAVMGEHTTEGYDTLRDWAEDHMLRVLQDAFYRCQKRKDAVVAHG